MGTSPATSGSERHGLEPIETQKPYFDLYGILVCMDKKTRVSGAVAGPTTHVIDVGKVVPISASAIRLLLGNTPPQ
jgi:hypothetical protein